jgi:hypothetical protein
MAMDSVYNKQDFERRFRVPREVFNRIHDKLMGEHPFIHYEDATKKKGTYPLVKLVACFRYIAYSYAYNQEDENLCVSKSALKPMVQDFNRPIVKHFGREFLLKQRR